MAARDDNKPNDAIDRTLKPDGAVNEVKLIGRDLSDNERVFKS